jgi:hypothetical protein
MKSREEAGRYEIAVIVVISVNAKMAGNIDEVLNGIRKDIDIKHIYITCKGLAGLGNKMKKITKTFEELSQEFYRKKRIKLKKKLSFREKMPTLQATLFKLNMKIGFLYELVYNNEKAFECFKQAYGAYTNAYKELFKSYSSWEVKAVGSLLRERLERYCLKQGQGNTAIKLFEDHYSLFKTAIHTLDKKEIYKEYKWRAEEFYRQTELLRECLTPGDELRKHINTWFSDLYLVR